MIACAGAMLALLPVAAHQLGLLEHLPDLPGGSFDSDAITESPAAHPFGMPDAVIGLGSFAVTLALLAAARGRSPVANRLLGLKLKADAGIAAFNLAQQPLRFGKLCSWCTAAAICAGMMVGFAERARRD